MHHGLHCLLMQNEFSEKEMQFYLEIIICDPLDIYNRPLEVSNQKEESIGA